MKRRRFLSIPAILASTGLGVGASARAQAPFAAVPPGQVLRGQFAQQRTLAGFAHPLQSSGDFVLAPGYGLIWRTVQPFAIVTVITEAGLVQRVNGAETTHLGTAQLPFLAKFYRLLSSALGGDWSRLETAFEITRRGDAQQWEIVLVPRGGGDQQAMPFSAITVRGGRFVDDVRIVRGNGDSDHLVFSDQALGGALSEAERGLLRRASP